MAAAVRLIYGVLTLFWLVDCLFLMRSYKFCFMFVAMISSVLVVKGCLRVGLS